MPSPYFLSIILTLPVLIVMELTDTELTLRLKHHDEVVFETLFRRPHHYLYTGAIQYVKDPALAEDALQEVYLILWTNREQTPVQRSGHSHLLRAA